MRASDPATTVRTLVGAIADDRVRDVLVELLLGTLTPPPAASTPPAPAAAPDPDPAARRREQNRKYAAARRAKRQQAAATKPAAQAARKRAGRPRKDNGGNGNDPVVTPQAFWHHAEKLEPTKPWLAVAREFNVKEAIAQNCYRNQSLPPHIGPMAVTKFLTLPAPALEFDEA
jgi:hypothetical protein